MKHYGIHVIRGIDMKTFYLEFKVLSEMTEEEFLLTKAKIISDFLFMFYNDKYNNFSVSVCECKGD